MIVLWLSILWVFASVAVACLPIRYQYIPGVALLIAAPVLIVAIGLHVGWIAAALAFAAVVSMYRNPLRYFIGKLKGENPKVPQ